MYSTNCNFFHPIADKEVPLDDKDVTKNPKEEIKVATKMLPSVASVSHAQHGLFWRHIAALSIKRFHHSRRNKKGILCEVAISHNLPKLPFLTNCRLFRSCCLPCSSAWPCS